VDRQLKSPRLPFELNWAAIADGRAPARRVVETLNVFEDSKTYDATGIAQDSGRRPRG